MKAYDYHINSISGEQDILAGLNGKVCLFVNISTKCGYVPECSSTWSYARTAKQLWELEVLHNKFNNFSVVGFPCNQFGNQEPSTNENIFNFIPIAYPFVTFPISEKISVNGEDEHPLYTFLKGPEIRMVDDTPADSSAAATAGQNKAGQAMYRVPHNYEKFLIDQNGSMVARFSWRDTPLAEKPSSSGSFMTVMETIRMYAEEIQ